MAHRVAVDIGGTFTDLVSMGEDGSLCLAKASTTPANFAYGALDTLRRSGLDPSAISSFFHGSTVIINALTERKGAKTALVTTRGFRDVLEIQRCNRPDMYNFSYRKPEPFVPRRYRYEVGERLSFRGEVLEALDEEAVRQVGERCKAEGIEAIAVCLLHSYANPRHEQRCREILAEACPEAYITLSHELTKEWREYERSNTAVLNAYVQPTADRYLKLLSAEFERVGLGSVKYAMQSNGGSTLFSQAALSPIYLVESGPVGAVIGARALGEVLGLHNLIVLDMGGTTTKTSLIDRGQVKINTEYRIEASDVWAGYPIKVPVVDIVEIGAGGGSIARIDEGGSLHVGPVSAGAEPGPASYAKGGTEPTVTDANVVAGRINPSYFLGGEIPLREDLAREALRPICSRFDVSLRDAARGVIRIVNANMVNALKLVSVRRGYDPRDFVLVACGGAAPMHATALARELKIGTVLVPTAPAHFSAWGMLMADLRHDFIQTRVMPFEASSLDAIRSGFAQMAQEARSAFSREGVPLDGVWLEYSADMRYLGQEHTVKTPLAAAQVDGTDLGRVGEGFHQLHEQRYSFRLADPIEVVNLHLVAWGHVEKPTLAPLPQRDGPAAGARKGTREVDFDDEGVHSCPIYERDRLPLAVAVPGPAVVEEPACTTVVYPSQRFTLDRYGNLLVSLVG